MVQLIANNSKIKTLNAIMINYTLFKTNDLPRGVAEWSQLKKQGLSYNI